MTYHNFSGLFLFTKDGDEDHIYRAGLRDDELEILDKIDGAPMLITYQYTGEVMDIGPRANTPILKIPRLPYEVRIQDLTKKQTKKMLLDLMDFIIYCLKKRVCVWDISESNMLYWNGKSYFVDLDAFSCLVDPDPHRSSYYGFVKLAYLYNRYLKKNDLLKSASEADHVTIRGYKDWTSRQVGRKDFGDPDGKIWKEFRKVIEDTPDDAKDSHWADEYARDESRYEDDGKVKIVIPMLENADGDTILDVGTNKGYYLHLMRDKYKYLMGFDIDEKCINIAEFRYGSDKAGFTQFAIEDVFAGTRETDSRIERYKSDIVLALAVTHHFHTCKIDPEKAAQAFADLSRKWILVEDIENQAVYKRVFEENGFALCNMSKSFPETRTLSLWGRSKPS